LGSRVLVFMVLLSMVEVEEKSDSQSAGSGGRKVEDEHLR
jgi:hypothetical protein